MKHATKREKLKDIRVQVYLVLFILPGFVTEVAPVGGRGGACLSRVRVGVKEPSKNEKSECSYHEHPHRACCARVMVHT